jgi:hypothetical protein
MTLSLPKSGKTSPPVSVTCSIQTLCRRASMIGDLGADPDHRVVIVRPRGSYAFSSLATPRRPPKLPRRSHAGVRYTPESFPRARRAKFPCAALSRSGSPQPSRRLPLSPLSRRHRAGTAPLRKAPRRIGFHPSSKCRPKPIPSVFKIWAEKHLSSKASVFKLRRHQNFDRKSWAILESLKTDEIVTHLVLGTYGFVFTDSIYGTILKRCSFREGPYTGFS